MVESIPYVVPLKSLIVKALTCAQIFSQIDEFSERLQDHRDDIQEEFGIGCDDALNNSLCAVGGDEDQRLLVEEQEEMSTTIKSLMEQTKVCGLCCWPL